MSTLNERSIALHREKRGKLEITSKVPLKTREDLSLSYTPGVAAVCLAIADNKSLSKELTMRGNAIAVVTDGSAVLGLGNIGPEAALPVMEGKAILFKEFGGIDAMPICLATQDTDEIVRIVTALAPTFGGINLEDISAPRCFEIERRLVEALDIPVLHDDQHGTAVVVLAGLINALKVTERDTKDVRIAMNGAGAAGGAIARMLHVFGFNDIVMCDTKGIITVDRPNMDDSKKGLASFTNPNGLSGTLADAVRGADIFIGVSAAGALTQDMVRSMAPNAIVFALANPTPEIMPELAKEAGAAVVATGRSDFANQVNNVLAFPGIFRGALDHNIRRFTPEMLIEAAKRLASIVPEPTADHILPDALDRSVAAIVADAIR